MDGVGRGPQDVIGQLVIELGGSLGVLLTAVGDETERARKTVTARIRDVLRRIERVHPALAEHLRSSLHTGVHCGYRPTTATRWRL